MAHPQAAAGGQNQASADGEKHQRLQKQQKDSDGRTGNDLHPRLDQQGEQQQDGGLEAQHLGRAERAERVKKHGVITGIPMLTGRSANGGFI